jgi:hypothetical protein
MRMSCVLVLLANLLAFPEGAESKPTTLRYVRQVKDKFVPESVVTETVTKEGTTYNSSTERGDETTTLTLRFDKDNKLQSAEVTLQAHKSKKTAVLTIQGKKGFLKRPGGIIELLDTSPAVVVTTAPDWSDILQLVRRFDRSKGGKQAFAGLWIHPVEREKQMTFTVEPLGEEIKVVVAPQKELKLQKYRIGLRSGDYLVWADASARVYKIQATGNTGTVVVLEGYEETIGKLK